MIVEEDGGNEEKYGRAADDVENSPYVEGPCSATTCGPNTTCCFDSSNKFVFFTVFYLVHRFTCCACASVIFITAIIDVLKAVMLCVAQTVRFRVLQSQFAAHGMIFLWVSTFPNRCIAREAILRHLHAYTNAVNRAAVRYQVNAIHIALVCFQKEKDQLFFSFLNRRFSFSFFHGCFFSVYVEQIAAL